METEINLEGSRNEVLIFLADEIKKAEPGSNEQKTLMEGYAKLYSLMQDDRKMDQERIDQSQKRADVDEQRAHELKVKNWEIGQGLIVEAMHIAEATVKSVVVVRIIKLILKFETSGTFTTKVFPIFQKAIGLLL